MGSSSKSKNFRKSMEFKEKQTILLRQDLRTFQFQVSQDTIDRNREPDSNWNNTNIENIALNAINQKLKRVMKKKILERAFI